MTRHATTSPVHAAPDVPHICDLTHERLSLPDALPRPYLRYGGQAGGDGQGLCRSAYASWEEWTEERSQGAAPAGVVM
ncbi:hypothetical protein B0H13DRAFT_2359306 [Mycena leptocephala]|nr:hypothetical protein B0H13DRAFT_2359306 [Mycena leptocephala]